jgi:acyl-CoA thioesterase
VFDKDAPMASVWDDVQVTAVAGRPGRFRAHLHDAWTLVAVPQGGVVAAVGTRAMEAVLDDPAQRLRTMTVVFAGQVAAGDVEVDVAVLRRGRSMSQLTATVRNPGAEAGLTAVAVFGTERRGFSFVDVHPPEVPGPEGAPSFRDGPPEGVDFTFDRPPMPFWDQILESRPVIGRAPWETFEDGPAEVAYWYRLDDPPLLADGALDPVGTIVLCDTMPGSVGQKIGPDAGMWFGPSADYTIHLFGPAHSGWLLSHQRARWAGDGYASIDMTLWDMEQRLPVAYATQMMFFAFGR